MKAKDIGIKDEAKPYIWWEDSKICFNPVARVYWEGCEAQAETAFKAGIREVVEIVEEMVRLLGKVVPANQDSMIEWAVKSQDSVYTNAGAAYWIGQAKLKEWLES